ncbi:MAG: hypothetical protein GXO47_00860 [Chlorobi bacterium]|nr:hypothetical protein [Chlorobiota bacterium]
MRYLKFLIPWLIVTSCNHETDNNKATDTNTKDTLKAGIIYEMVTCKRDTSLNYSLYIPVNNKSSQKPSSVIFFFDAHKRGLLPVKKYKNLADRYGIILAGSNNSENGNNIRNTQLIVNNFIKDVKKRFMTDNPDIIASGFSGGARVAVMAAISGQYGIKGVIGCAAGFPEIRKPANLNFTWTGVVGNQDFNFLEMANLNRQLKAAGFNSHLIVFDGEHEWPPVEAFDDALNIQFGGNSEEFHDNRNTQQAERVELQQQQILAGSFQAKDISWWNSTISSLKKKKDKATDEVTRLMSARLLNYLSMISFIYANNALEQENPELAKKYLEIYEKADPDNPDVYFFKAEYFMLTGKKNKAISMLKKSADAGFYDIDRLTENRYFKNIKDEPDFKKAEEKIISNKKDS